MSYSTITLLGLVSIGVTVLFAGCISPHDRVTRKELPPAWLEATQPSQEPPMLTGTFENSGEYLHEQFKNQTQPRPISKTSLAPLLFPENQSRIRAQQVRLVQHDQSELEIVLILNGEIVASKTVQIKVDAKTGEVNLPHYSRLGAGGNLAAAMNVSSSLVLYKGRDGDLYCHFKTNSTGVIGAVVPTKISIENWGRWKPVQPNAD